MAMYSLTYHGDTNEWKIIAADYEPACQPYDFYVKHSPWGTNVRHTPWSISLRIYTPSYDKRRFQVGATVTPRVILGI